MEAQYLPKIRVVVRKRPLNRKEINKNDADILRVDSEKTLVVQEVKTKVDLSKFIEEHSFTFDNVFGEEATNADIYQTCVQPLIAAAFQGAKVSCFAYGQTGSGKTFTMMGPNPIAERQEHPGIYLQAAYDIFNLLNYEEYSGYKITCSLFEIYCGKLHDLLNKRKEVHARCDAKERVKIMGLQEAPCEDESELMQVINYGLTERTTGKTGANSDSSRSHAIMQVVLRDPDNKMAGKMSFIDLAGSERGADTAESNKKTRQDGAEINKSLLALKECIRALDKDKKHTPFRGSKLTQVLKDSFVGNCKTVMIANVSPGQSCCENTLNSLRYADRVKELKNENRDKSDDLMLARNGVKTTKKEIKKQHSFEATTLKIKNLPAALQRTESANQNQKDFTNKIGRIQTAKARKSAKLQAPSRSQMQGMQGTKSPKFRKSNAPGGGLQINSKPKNFQELNENVQNIQSMMGGKPDPFYQAEKKRPFARQDSNKQIAPRSNNFTSQKSSADINMEVDAPDSEPVSLERMCHDHESLVNQILQEEEDLLASHKKYIDDLVDGVKKQMVILHEVDKPGSDIEKYISDLHTMLRHNISIANGVCKQLKVFETHLKEEEDLSQKFHDQQKDQEMHMNNEEMYQEERYNEEYQEQNLHDDEFMDDLYDLEVTPSEPNHEDNLVNPPAF